MTYLVVVLAVLIIPLVIGSVFVCAPKWWTQSVEPHLPDWMTEEAKPWLSGIFFQPPFSARIRSGIPERRALTE